MKKKIIAVISGAVILIIAAGSIYGKPESSHKEGEPDVVGTFSVNRDENLTVIANRKNIEDREAFARELLQMYKDDSFHSTKFSTDRGYATSLDMNIYLWKEDIKNEMFYNADWSGVNISEFIGILNDYLYWYNEKRIKKSLGYLSPIEYRHRLGLVT
ncbi:Uncharacterised protein [uncultured Clostridium sp.]|nr:Uncharacterised protein [uncultured Clostridium sp.]